MLDKKCYYQIRGMIFDSAPGERRFSGLYRAIAAIYGRKPFNKVVSVMIALSLMIIWYLEVFIINK